MLHRLGKFRRPVALVMLSVFLVAQLLLPLTARAFFFGGVSLKDEKEMGHKFDVAIRSSLPMVDDPEVSKYVDGLVRRLVKAIPPQPFTFTSGVILHNAMNAFAIPGGHVYVFTGLIMNFEDESQLAGVLSHELAHVTQRHVASRLERAQYLSVGSLLLAIAGVAVGGPAGGAVAVGALGAGQSAMLNYSRLARLSSFPASIRNRSFDNRRFKRVQTVLWGRYGDSQAALQRFSGKDALSCMGRGMVLSRRNNVREAASAFDQALQLAPKDPLVLREAGTFHYRKGDMARAEGLLRQAMQLDKNDFMARFFYARMLDETGRAQQAQPYYTEVLRAVPEAADVHEAYARSLGSIGKTGLAYIHMAYSAIYSNNRKLAERYFKQAKAKTEKSADSAAFRKLDAVYKERKEIWEDR